MIYSDLARLRETIISYTGSTFTGKGDPFSKNLIRHVSFMNSAYSRGPDFVAVIFLRAEKYFDFRGPASGVYNRYYDEASEEIAINCIKIMENYIFQVSKRYNEGVNAEHEQKRLISDICICYRFLMKLKGLRKEESTDELYLDILSIVCKIEHSFTGNNDLLRKYEKEYEHYKPYSPHPLLERGRSTKK